MNTVETIQPVIQSAIQLAPATILLSEYRPPAFFITQTDLHFELDPLATLVTAQLQLQRNHEHSEKDLVLQGEQLELLSVSLNGALLQPPQYQLASGSLRIVDAPDEFVLIIKTRIQPANNTALEGLYISGGNFCTQCEAEGFRRITYYLDRPDVLSRFTVEIHADQQQYPVLLSNGNRMASGQNGAKHWVRWQDPFPKPAYLFALVAGDLQSVNDTFVTRSQRTVSLQIFVQAHNVDKCAHAMASLKRAMAWDEQRCQLEYDLDIYMIVAVDDFNMGAMENKGLNIFNSKFVLAKAETATDSDFEHIEGVIGHEYFHNWSGNRVTCRDWFQLSLKEGLTVFRDQEFSADVGSRAIKRIDDVRMLRTAQFAEDAGPMAHPIRPESYIEINNFYTVTVYEKGAEVIRMQHTLLGEAGFQKGLALYFQRHDGQAVTCDDFVSAMETANNIDLTQFKRWYSQAGTPSLMVSDHYDAAQKTYTLYMQQHCAVTPGQIDKQAFVIPVALGLLSETGVELLPTQIVSLAEAAQTFVYTNISEKPIPSLLRNFSAPVKLQYAYTDAQLEILAQYDTDSFNRFEAMQRLSEKTINQLLALAQQAQDLQVPENYSNLLNSILNETKTDPALIAEMISLPSERYLMEQHSIIPLDDLLAVRKKLQRVIGKRLYSALREKYDEMASADYHVDGISIARRRLRNVCLNYLVATERQDAIELCLLQYRHANNMTDQLAALALLANVDGVMRFDILDDFYAQWQHDGLVLDKWFAVQATAQLPDTLMRVKALMANPTFSLSNPNKVRALIGAFCMNNPAGFHAKDGSAYVFLADILWQLEEKNPQVAARIVSAFNAWRRFDEGRQILMREQLERLLNKPGLSRDVYEIVSRALLPVPSSVI
ncbi:MAG: aminopeptidase N [Gammaproteobacteria bacterium]|nr:aminopeptidase N [Gammaproteobacteria bacterium]